MLAQETFRWHYYIFDIAAINADLRIGQLSGCSVKLDRAVIEWYSRCGLGLEGAARIFPQIPEPNVEYAKTLSADRKIEPIVLVCFERAKFPESDLTAGLDVGGILNYD